MQKIFIEFSYKINEREFRFSCEPNSPFSDCKDAIFQYMKDLSSIEESQKSQTQQPVEEKPQEQPQEQVNGE